MGLYGIGYADDVLKADEIHLIGLDYKGLDNGGNNYTEIWIAETKKYLKKRTGTGIIIDHSNGDFPL